jgi:molecular chaperone GrpE
MTDQDDKIEISYVPDDDEQKHNADSPESDHFKNRKAKKENDNKKLHEKLKKQEEILKKVVNERDETKDKYLRVLAEMDNFRKRIRKEKDEYFKFALSEFLFALLPIIDNLERALSSKSSANSGKSLISGVEMIWKQMIDLLKKYQVKEIEALEKPFNPNFHQALSKEEREGIQEPVVVEIYQKGYTYQDKLLRPSLTKVAVPKTGEPPDEPEAEEE